MRPSHKNKRSCGSKKKKDLIQEVITEERGEGGCRDIGRISVRDTDTRKEHFLTNL
jgi:hypothetical protein